ncbi:MAG: bifunctional orotidine-5'-phosphate decarboxylase/orotate phosphoribosyltransferase [Oscillatoriales cyanobacterium RM1_1_9]|nr:bifunctional orotidine-5'-phosphate decarboxylase/orotate phosphoribosyltransferase [Oscillatoriales cyanobacterium SM2_3_0]NJO46265.1 bifunctional orotidine-5'-phosphate decarboxylase/orotate phosphoribosyltransferase [Oscillatoriales cyanobacterium RM2_1_1]NJO71864.1 bifunctional orotidine-5'-phosphate decarboxylase/orotate phosphoribosyltransferase [Oscillatoriales cyanobacterium RM1_1_9]
MNFFNKLLTAIDRYQSLLYVDLNPDPEAAHLRFTDHQDRIKHLLQQTQGQICAFKLNLGLYQASGTAGLELLQWALQQLPPDIPTILDAKFGDLNSSTAFARLVFEQWRCDACTIVPYGGQDQVTPFLLYPGKAVLILGTTANPSAARIQDYPNPQQPLYLELIKTAQTWGTPDQLGLTVGMMADVLALVRKAVPERLILVEGNVAEENDLTQEHDLISILAAGLNPHGEGLLLPVPPRLLSESTNSEALKHLRDSINLTRRQIVEDSPTCELWLPDVCFLEAQPHRDLILQLYDIGCILFGEHVQASGKVFPYYIDLRRIISIPQVFHQIVRAYADILQQLTFDRIAGIPYGSLPTATGLALRLERPMIFPRKEVKAHGTGRLIEGHFQLGETIVVVDDILITGNSVVQGAEKLKSVGLQVQDIVVLIDHGNNVRENLQNQGYQAHSVLSLNEIAETLYQSNRISAVEFAMLQQG